MHGLELALPMTYNNVHAMMLYYIYCAENVKSIDVVQVPGHLVCQDLYDGPYWTKPLS